MLVNSESVLEAFLNKAKALGKIAVDTEFSRKQSYFPQISIIQFGLYEGQTIAVDFLENTHLLPIVKDILIDENVLKVFHSLEQDLSGLNRHFNIKVAPIFDTQIASNITGVASDISYENLSQKLLGVVFDESFKGINYNENWLSRPLSQKHIDYALSDVLHLLKIHDILQKKLVELNRASWLSQEQQRFFENDFDIKKDQDIIKNIDFNYANNSVKKKYYKAYLWREHRARRLNVPKNSVVSEKQLFSFATGKFESVKEDAKQEILNFFAKEIPESGDVFLNINQQDILSILKLYVRYLAKNLGINEKLICNSFDLKDFLINKQFCTCKLNIGWRKVYIMPKLLDFIEGKISAKINGFELLFE